MKRLNSNEIKLRNRQLIYQYIRKTGSVTKQDLVVSLDMSLPTVTQNLNYLKEHRLVDASQKVKRGIGGRNATAYTYIRNPRLAIGVYLTEHHISVVAVDLSGNVIQKARDHVLFDLESDAYLQKIGSMVETVKKEAEIADEDLLGVGIAVPGLVSEDGEVVTYGMTFRSSGKEFTGKTRKEVAKYIPYKNRLYHDSYTAGFAELWANPQLGSAFYLSLVNSLGGCVIINHQIYEGDSHKSGEIGHMVVVPKGGKKCYCGKTGCFDTECRAGVLDAYTDGNLEEFFSLLHQKDRGAQKLWEQYLDTLALAIVNIRILFDSTVILGGYVGSYIGDYLPELFKRIDERFPFLDKAKDYVRQCTCTTEASASGAALQYVEDFINKV